MEADMYFISAIKDTGVLNHHLNIRLYTRPSEEGLMPIQQIF